MAGVLEGIVDEYKGIKSDFFRIRHGYRFARELVKNVRERSDLIVTGQSNTLNDLGLVLQLAEYQFALNDVQNKEDNPYSAGVVLYGVIHPKESRFLNGMYKHLEDRLVNPQLTINVP